MQKYLRLLNLRLDVIVKDIVGLTGLKIINAICAGETCPRKLASFRNGNCKKSEEEIAKAHHTNGRQDFLFALKHEHFMYQTLQKSIQECDVQIKAMLEEQINSDENKKQLYIDKKVHKRINKNTFKNIDLNLMAYQYFDGVDLFAIEGVSHATVLSIISEVEIEGFYKYKTGKLMTAWARLVPNNKISGGKVLSHKVPKGSTRLKIALRNAAQAIGQLNGTTLSDFFKRIHFRKGPVATITATARKLLIIIHKMVTTKQPYKNEQNYEFLDQKRKRKVQEMKKLIHKFNVSTDELGLQIQCMI